MANSVLERKRFRLFGVPFQEIDFTEAVSLPPSLPLSVSIHAFYANCTFVVYLIASISTFHQKHKLKAEQGPDLIDLRRPLEGLILWNIWLLSSLTEED